MLAIYSVLQVDEEMREMKTFEAVLFSRDIYQPLDCSSSRKTVNWADK